MFCRSPKVSALRRVQGSAMLETTLVVPVLVCLLIASMFLSQKLQARSLITTIAQEAARLKARDTNIMDECTYVASLDNIIPIREQCPNQPIPQDNLVSQSHFQIYNLLDIMNHRDNKFRIRNIRVRTYYREDPITPEHNDYVVVEVEADVNVDSMFSDSILERAGVLAKRTRATALQPYLLSKD